MSVRGFFSIVHLKIQCIKRKKQQKSIFILLMPLFDVRFFKKSS